MPFIGNQPALSYTSFAVQHFTTSATTSYTLDHSVANENEIRLVINNVVQQPGSSYAYTASGTTLTLSAATSATDTMYAVFLGKAVQTVTPASGSVTNAMLGETITVANGGTGVTTASALANTGNLVLLSSATASNDATVSFDSSSITDTYKVYKLIYNNIRLADDNNSINMQFSSDNGSSYISSQSYYRNIMHAFSTNTNDSTVFYKTGQVNTAIKFGGLGVGLGALNREQTSGHIDFYNLKDNTNGKSLNIFTTFESSGGGSGMNWGTYYFDDASVVNNFKIYAGSGNITSGTFSLYGVKT